MNTFPLCMDTFIIILTHKGELQNIASIFPLFQQVQLQGTDFKVQTYVENWGGKKLVGSAYAV